MFQLTGLIPHDPGAFTQGLEIQDGYLWESTGMYGSSTFRRTSLENGEVLDVLQFPSEVFAEGFTFLSDSLVCLLTWREGKAFVINPWTMETQGEYPLQGEGWGLCLGDDNLLYQSNGTSILQVRSPDTFEIVDSLAVTSAGRSQFFLNELEFYQGYILANQWRTSRILFISPATGEVDRVLNLGNIVPEAPGVMNGIAATEDGRLLCSGKNWPVTLVLSERE